MCVQSQVDVLASLVHPRVGRKWRNRFVMIEAYFDESGIHDGARVCIVGGFYSHQSAWRKFEGQWNKILEDYPDVKERGFHAKEFFGRRKDKGIYGTWSDEKADKLLERLVQAISRNNIVPIAYGVIVKDFLELPLMSRQWLTDAKFSKSDGKVLTSGCPRKSYYVPFQFCVLKSAQVSGADSIEKIHFFAGLDKTLAGYASDLYRFLLRDDRLPQPLRDLLGGIGYPLSKDTPGIQAADLLVNRLYHDALIRINNPNSTPSRLVTQLMKKCRPEPTW